MPLWAHTHRETLPVPGAGTLLRRLLEAGLPVGSACSGRGACGRCAVRILEGADALSAADVHEREVLLRNLAGADMRLSCQCRALDSSANVRVSTDYW